MIFNESADKEIAVIIPGMAAQDDRLPGLLTGRFKIAGVQLILKKWIVQPLIDQRDR